MRTSRFGHLLLVVGGAVGAAAVIGLVVGFEPAKLPAALLNIAVYKLTFAAAAGLLAAGAIVRRYGQRDAKPSRDDGPTSVLGGAHQNELVDGAPPDRLPVRSDRTAQRIDPHR